MSRLQIMSSGIATPGAWTCRRIAPATAENAKPENPWTMAPRNKAITRTAWEASTGIAELPRYSPTALARGRDHAGALHECVKAHAAPIWSRQIWTNWPNDRPGFFCSVAAGIERHGRRGGAPPA